MNIAPEEMPRELARLEDENERLEEKLKYTIPIVEHNQTIQSNINSYNKLAEYSKELEDNLEEQLKLTNRFANKSKELQQRIDKAIEDLFELKDMIYKPETREKNFGIQNKITSIIKNLGSDEE